MDRIARLRAKIERADRQLAEDRETLRGLQAAADKKEAARLKAVRADAVSVLGAAVLAALEGSSGGVDAEDLRRGVAGAVASAPPARRAAVSELLPGVDWTRAGGRAAEPPDAGARPAAPPPAAPAEPGAAGGGGG